jgi:hypothetical protein
MSGEAWLIGAAVASPILAFFGGSVGSRVAGRADNRLDKWRRREEAMRTIRWAAEKAVDLDPRVSEIGYTALEGLDSSELLQPEERRFLQLVTAAAVVKQVESVPSTVDTDADER